jgi:hypothetical protein
MAGKVISYADAFRDKLERGTKSNLQAAGIYLADKTKKLISTKGTAGGTTRDDKGKLRTVKLIYNAHPSSPGNPPHVQTGRLRGSVAWVVERNGKMLVVRVGTNVKYGRSLEMGTKKLQARPWLRPALAIHYRNVRTILTTPIL